MKKILQYIAAAGLLFLILAPMTQASLWSYYKEKGQSLPTVAERAVDAAEVGIYNYTGTFSQNILLEQRMRELDESINSDLLGFAVATRYRTRLSSSMTSTQLTVPVSSITSFDGTTLTMALLDGVVFLTIEPGTSREEIVKCTSVSGTTWATCTRGLAFTGKTETEVTANRKAHNAGSTVVMSNVHYIFNQLADLDTTETFSGLKIFEVHPQASSTLGTNTTTLQYTTKNYVDNVTNQGAATSTESNGGIVQLATPAQNGSSTPYLDTDEPRVQQSIHATSSPSVVCTTQVCDVWAMINGKIKQTWLDLTEVFTWSGNHTFNGTAGFNNTTTIAASATTTSGLVLNGVAYQFPATEGTASTTLATNGDGQLVWETAVEPGFATTTSQAFTGSTEEDYLDDPLWNIGASEMGALGYAFQLNYSNYRDSDGGDSVRVKVYIGSTAVCNVNLGVPDTTNNAVGTVTGHIIAKDGKSNEQACTGTAMWVASSKQNAVHTSGSGTEDMTTAQTLKVTVDWEGSINGTRTFNINSFVINRIGG